MTVTTQMPSWLDVGYVADDLHMSEEWVRRQCHNGTIPATKVGRSWRIAAVDYATFMRKYRGASTPPSRDRDAEASTAAKRSRRNVR